MSSPMAVRDKDMSIAALAERISSLSSQLSSYLASNSFPEPRFTPDAGNVPETHEYEALRAPLNDAALDLLRLINGPRRTLQEFFFSQYDLAALQIALDRRLFEHVPLPAAGSSPQDGDRAGEVQKASVAEIARKAGMDEDRTGRVMKMLATHRIFEEVVVAADGSNGDSESSSSTTTTTSSFTHTASSAVLARDDDFHATAAMQMDDMLRAASELSAVVTRSPFASDAAHSAFHERFGVSMYQYYEQRPDKARRFTQAMSSWSKLDRSIEELHTSFPWASLKDGTVVDIGGGNGHISIGLAQKFPSLHFVVQDISPQMLSQAQQQQQDHGDGRVTFQQHDFFDPQPVQDASAFLLRQCLHNNSDSDAVRIIRAVVPALERCAPGTPLLINEVILPEPGTATRFEEHHLRQVDFCMMVTLGAKQRTEGEFDRLVKEADRRLEIVGVHRNPQGVGLLEVQLNVPGR
ncbi:O-methyltransferase-domain-containing protein [Nemania abortiva]|nr:O-methyltransferase-domain-containing protein [Nemania abortiva]